MGLAASSGRDNDELVDKLVEANLITSKKIERAMRLVDRGRFFPAEHRNVAYRDIAWRSDTGDPGRVHISAPCIYANVLQFMDFREGQSFLNIGSGTGYLNTIAGFLIGSLGQNHGIEIHQNIVDYAEAKVNESIYCPEMGCCDWGAPEFTCGNGLLLSPEHNAAYDRVYCGAAVPESHRRALWELIKVGGIIIYPSDDQLHCVRRLGPGKFEVRVISSVSFTNFILPSEKEVSSNAYSRAPTLRVHSLQRLAAITVRRCVRAAVSQRNALHIRALNVDDRIRQIQNVRIIDDETETEEDDAEASDVERPNYTFSDDDEFIDVNAYRNRLIAQRQQRERAAAAANRAREEEARENDQDQRNLGGRRGLGGQRNPGGPTRNPTGPRDPGAQRFFRERFAAGPGPRGDVAAAAPGRRPRTVTFDVGGLPWTFQVDAETGERVPRLVGRQRDRDRGDESNDTSEGGPTSSRPSAVHPSRRQLALARIAVRAAGVIMHERVQFLNQFRDQGRPAGVVVTAREHTARNDANEEPDVDAASKGNVGRACETSADGDVSLSSSDSLSVPVGEGRETSDVHRSVSVDENEDSKSPSTALSTSKDGEADGVVGDAEKWSAAVDKDCRPCSEMVVDTMKSESQIFSEGGKDEQVECITSEDGFKDGGSCFGVDAVGNIENNGVPLSQSLGADVSKLNEKSNADGEKPMVASEVEAGLESEFCTTETENIEPPFISRAFNRFFAENGESGVEHVFDAKPTSGAETVVNSSGDGSQETPSDVDKFSTVTESSVTQEESCRTVQSSAAQEEQNITAEKSISADEELGHDTGGASTESPKEVADVKKSCNPEFDALLLSPLGKRISTDDDNVVTKSKRRFGCSKTVSTTDPGGENVEGTAEGEKREKVEELGELKLAVEEEGSNVVPVLPDDEGEGPNKKESSNNVASASQTTSESLRELSPANGEPRDSPNFSEDISTISFVGSEERDSSDEEDIDNADHESDVERQEQVTLQRQYIDTFFEQFMARLDRLPVGRLLIDKVKYLR